MIVLAGRAIAAESELRFGLTPVFLDNRVSFLRSWRTYLESRLGRPVGLVQRQTYREITDLLLRGEIDFAWICGFPYVRLAERLKLMVVPVYQGEPLYRSYLIVAEGNGRTHTLADLEGKTFAYSDPDSNSGYLYPQVAVHQLGRDPGKYFGRTFFAWSHHNVIVAVADGLAEGGAVDGYVWDTLSIVSPALVGRTRVIAKSEPFGFPPIVASLTLVDDDFNDLQKVFVDMNTDPAGRTLLHELNLDGFATATPLLYQGIRENWHLVRDQLP